MKSLLGAGLVALGALVGVTVLGAQTIDKLALSQAIDEALKNNPEIAAFRSKLLSGRARGGQASYLEDPEFNLEAWGLPLNRPTSIRSANPIIFGLRQKVPFFGKRELKGEIAASEVRMAEEDLRAKQIEIMANVKNTYADYFMAEKSIEIAKGHL